MDMKTKKILVVVLAIVTLLIFVGFFYNNNWRVVKELPPDSSVKERSMTGRGVAWSGYMLHPGRPWSKITRAPQILQLKDKNVIYILNQGIGFHISSVNLRAFLGGTNEPVIKGRGVPVYPAVERVTECPGGDDGESDEGDQEACYKPGPGIEDDKVVSWKKFVEKKALDYIAAEKDTKNNPNGNKISWQIGNEINNQTNSQGLRSWFVQWRKVHNKTDDPNWGLLGTPSRWKEYKNASWLNDEFHCEKDKDGNEKKKSSWALCTTKRNDETLIPYYVEYELAPTIEILLAVKKETGRDFDVSLGSIATARYADSRDWLNKIMNYSIKGIYAPSLKGKKVIDLFGSDGVMDHVSIQYLATFDYHQSSEVINPAYVDGSWESALNEIYDKWIKTGKIKGIWVTEEVGNKDIISSGRAQPVAIKVFSRYMHWWLEKSLPPRDNLVAFFRPPELADSVKDPSRAIDEIYDFFGSEAKIFENAKGYLSFSGKEDKTEAYAFGSNSNDVEKTAIIIFPKTIQKEHDIELKDIYIPEGGNINIKKTYLFAEGSPQELSGTSATKDKNKYKISLASSVKLTNQSVLVIFLEKSLD